MRISNSCISIKYHPFLTHTPHIYIMKSLILVLICHNNLVIAITFIILLIKFCLWIHICHGINNTYLLEHPLFINIKALFILFILFYALCSLHANEIAKLKYVINNNILTTGPNRNALKSFEIQTEDSGRIISCCSEW